MGAGYAGARRRIAFRADRVTGLRSAFRLFDLDRDLDRGRTLTVSSTS